MSADRAMLVLDASVLSPFARAGRLDALERLTQGYRRVTVREVLRELQVGSADYPMLLDTLRTSWLTTVSTDTLEVLAAFGDLRLRFGSGPRDVGEAAVLAYAQVHGAEALIDDQTAYDIGTASGVVVRRTLGLMATAVRSATLSGGDAEVLVDALRAAEARLPCDGPTFLAWCSRNGLT